MPGGEKLVGFTRILHRTSHDLLMDEASSSWPVLAESPVLRVAR